GAGAPAQFIFNRSAIAGEGQGGNILAFVISASSGDRQQEEQQTLAQAHALGIPAQPLHTICERRATFACTPALQRPPMHIARGLLACGDYIAGPYPATLEGAVMSGEAAAAALQSAAS
ncbi:MAG: desaturase, partial [Ottowia sp.]|nr:desaturase [Ottowia sp.]